MNGLWYGQAQDERTITNQIPSDSISLANIAN